MLLPVLLRCIALAPQGGSVHATLDALEAKLAPVAQAQDAKSFAIQEEVQAALLECISNDRLHEASDFRRAAGLFAPSSGDLLPLEARYELLLVAAAEGDAEARSKLGLGWDNLLVGMGRGRRIGALKIAVPRGGEAWEVHPTADAILAVYCDPAGAAAAAKEKTNNLELQELVDADQKARDFDFSKVTPAQLDEMSKGDATRLRRTKEIVQAGTLATADDFDHAALVFQHGNVFEDYATAHELSVCALLLGKRTASWLAGASYDRMLVHCGIPQRFATQYGGVGGVTRLQRVETWGINDTERKRIVRTTLEEARKRKF